MVYGLEEQDVSVREVRSFVLESWGLSAGPKVLHRWIEEARSVIWGLIIRIGFWGTLDQNYSKEHQNSIGNFFGPDTRPSQRTYRAGVPKAFQCLSSPLLLGVCLPRWLVLLLLLLLLLRPECF